MRRPAGGPLSGTVSKLPFRSRLLLACLGWLLLGAAGHAYRYSRAVTAPNGWAVLELPDDVLAAARPGLPDLRLFAETTEIAFAFEDRISARASSIPFIDVTRRPERDTTALIDRGEHRGLVDSIELATGGTEPFLKPLILEASEDRTRFREVARASIFQVPEATMTRVSFAPSDSRYLRVRLDDRESAPIEPVSAWLAAVAPAAPGARPIAVELARARAGSDLGEVYEVELPSKNLPAVALQLEIAEPVFSRRVRVYEALVFRDDLSRRLVGEGHIERATTGSEQVRIPLSGLTSSEIEVELEHQGPPLSVEGGTLWVSHERLVFRVPEGSGKLRLHYGSPSAEGPAYDLAQALAAGLPRELATATLGPAEDRGEETPLPRVLRGPPIDQKGFARRRPIRLPTHGRLAYLDLAGVPLHQAEGVRIVDAAGRQVPFVVELEPRQVSLPLRLEPQGAGQVSVTRATGFDPKESSSSLSLLARSPTYFRREVSIYETTRDERGPTGKQWLGHALWERPADAPSAPVSIPLTQPSTGELLIEMEQGDNLPLTLSHATLEVRRARIDFLFEPDDKLVLLSDNPTGTPAAYDLALIRDAVVRLPAKPAALVDTPATPTAERAGRPWWFWLAMTGAAALVIGALVRVLRSE